YAPTWSPASSLNVAGEDIVKSLVDAGFNVIVKLHDRSLDPTEPRFSGGIDWRARFARTHVPGRIAFVEWADSSPLLAASDVMVTDHSSVGFEFCLLDRPLVIFDAPDLARVARINPEKIELLRSAARVVRTAGEVGPAALEEMVQPEHLGDARRAIAGEMFLAPGTALPAEQPRTFKLAFYNIRSGIGMQPLGRRPAPFAETVNCDPTAGAVNAWGAGIVQAELARSVKNDTLVIALGLAEAWNCGSPTHV